MKIKIFFFLILTSFLYCKKIPPFPQTKIHFPRDPKKRTSNYPYLSGDTFRAFCDFIIDETNMPFDPDNVRDGDTIFVVNYYKFLDYFFKEIHPLIKAKYILITHNYLLHDNINKYAKYLNDENIIAWFGKNVIIDHPKTHPLPLGINNKFDLRGNPNFFDKLRNNLPINKNILLYMNFTVGSPGQRRWSIRKKVVNIFKNKKFCFKTKRKNFTNYIDELSKSKFVLSPEGNGIDCHRTWEALYMGSIPIVTTSGLDILFKDLPILIIDNWEQIKKIEDLENFFNTKYKKIINQKYKMEKLFAPYWFNKINNVRNKILYKRESGL